MTLMFKNSLEGFIELTQSHYTHSYGLLQWKDADGNQAGDKVYRAEPRKAPCAVLPWCRERCYFLPAVMCDTHTTLPNKDAHLSRGLQFPPGLQGSLPSRLDPSRARVDTTWLKASTRNHNVLCGLRSRVKERHSHQVGHPKGLESPSRS